ncbi:MAG: TerC/Alx family metal homeostasis membrane protein [Bacteroidota bacterium]
MNENAIFWVAFTVVFVIAFLIDMYATTSRKTIMTEKVALRWTGLWVSIALLFGFFVYLFYPATSSVSSTDLFNLYLQGYLIEYSLSVDNLFAFIMIFSLMGVSESNQPKLLKLGVFMSIIFRILFILAGTELVQKFEWVMYIFGAILIWTAYKMAFSGGEEDVDPKNNFMYKWASKLFPVDPDTHSEKFFTVINGKRHITTIFLVLLVIGSTNIIFSLDSIPAIIGIVKSIPDLDPRNFIAISSSVFAVMGLVSLFFALKGIMKMFRFMQQGVCFILFFIGFKMIAECYEPIKNFFESYQWITLFVILFSLIFSIILSMVIEEKEEIDELKSEIEDMKKDINNNNN